MLLHCGYHFQVRTFIPMNRRNVLKLEWFSDDTKLSRLLSINCGFNEGIMCGKCINNNKTLPRAKLSESNSSAVTWQDCSLSWHSDHKEKMVVFKTTINRLSICSISCTVWLVLFVVSLTKVVFSGKRVHWKVGKDRKSLKSCLTLLLSLSTCNAFVLFCVALTLSLRESRSRFYWRFA